MKQLARVLLWLVPGLVCAQTATVTTTGTLPTSSATATGPMLLTPADYKTLMAKQNALGFTPENAAHKNAESGYAGLDSAGKLPWVQISGIPTASGTTSGILSYTDWLRFNSQQSALGYTPENVANKGIANGYASLGSTGVVPASQLPPPATKVSQLANDSGFVNALQSAASAPVQTVNGLKGNVTIAIPTPPSKFSQLTNDIGVVNATQAAAAAPVQSINGQTGNVTISMPSIPTALSQFTNDAGFITASQAANAAPVQSVNGSTGAVTLAIPSKLSELTNDIGLTINGSQVPIPTAVSQLTNDTGFVTAQTAPVTSVNGQTGAVTVSAANVPTAVSQLQNDAGYLTAATLPAPPVSSVNGQTGAVNIALPNVPTNVSQLTNDVGFVTSSQAPVQSVNGQTGAVSLALPSVPTNISQLANDSGFITSSSLPTKVSQLQNDAAFITASAIPVTSVNGKTGAVSISMPTGMLMASNNFSDVSSIPTALKNLGLTGSTAPATLDANISGNAATASAIKGTGPFSAQGQTTTPPAAVPPVGYLAMWFDTSDQNLHLLDNVNDQATLVRTTKEGVSTNCSAGSFVSGFASNGNPQCSPLFVRAPANATATGAAGQMAYDSGYFYICVAANSWMRTAISAW